MSDKSKTGLIVVLSCFLLGFGVFIGFNWNNWFVDEVNMNGVDTNAQDYEGNKETYTGNKNIDTIDIPGFDSMNIQAGVTNQKVNLYNPEQNTCFFKMTILLNDGTKLWESNLIEPGKALYDITLNQSLSVGAYQDCTLKYECYAMDEDQTPLNGSDIKFTLNVLE